MIKIFMLLSTIMLVGQMNAYEIYSAKKGLGSSDPEKIEAVHSSWYYNWDIQRVVGVDPAIEYVPMKHNRWWRSESELANIGEFNYFLGFNEPEAASQGNITVTQAIGQWPNLQASVAAYGNPGAQMGSPVTANPGLPWIVDFMNQVNSGGLKVDFMTMHKYPTPVGSDSIMGGAKWYYDTYGKDVWITEFNAADWSGSGAYTQSQTYSWLVEVLYRMESTDYIKRYAIFPWNAGSGQASQASPVFEVDELQNATDVLTPLGKLYAEYRSDDVNGPYDQTWYYLHNKGSRSRLCDEGGVPSTANIFREGAPVEYELILVGGGNFYIVNRATAKRLGSNGTTTYWTATETESSVQWHFGQSSHNWSSISHVASNNYLYGLDTGEVGMGATVQNSTYQWCFIRSGTAYGVAGNNQPTFTSAPLIKSPAISDIAYSDTIIADATDIDGDSLTFSIIAGPEWLRVAPSGVLYGTPAIQDAGVNLWTIQVSDGNGDADTVTLNISVVDTVNLPPVWNSPPANYNATEGVLWRNYNSWRVSDPEGDTIRWAKVSGPAWVTVNLSSGELSGTPQQGDVGTSPITLSITDNINPPVEVTANLTVSNVNDAPFFTVDPINEANATETVAYSGSIANATDADGDILEYSKVSGPAWLVVATDGSLSGTPAAEDIGANVFSVQVIDGNGGSAAATLNITVAPPVNLPPVWNSPPANYNATEGVFWRSYNSWRVSDPEGDPIRWAKVSGPAWVTVNLFSGELSGTPQRGDVGTSPITLSITDGNSSPVEVTAQIVVEAAAPPSVHVSAIVPSVANAGGTNRYGVATVTVLDADGRPVSGATVSGTFSGSYRESGSAVTNASGVVVIRTLAKTKKPSFTFTVNSVSASGYNYDSAANVETSDSY